jgi:subtilisin family serine protease
MRHTPLALTLASALVLAACADAPEPTAPAVPTASQARIAQPQLATLQTGAAGYVVFGTSNRLSKRLEQEVAAAGGTITGRVDEIGVAFVSSDNPDFAQGLNGFQAIPDLILRSGPTEEVAFTETPQGAGDDEPFFPFQWGMRAIHAPEAWDDGSRGAGVVVAVLDEGFDLDHPDLEYADGAMSFVCWQVVDGVEVLAPPPYCESVEYAAGFDYGPGTVPADPDAWSSHATHVSGIISALDNGVGVIGVAPDAHVMPVKVLSEYLGGGTTSWIVQGIVYAANAGADVINMSLGGVVDLTTVPPGQRDDVMLSTIVIYRRAVNYAYQHGTTVVASAGNDGIDADGDGHRWIRPAEFENAITVSATGPVGIYYDPTTDVDRPASYTNYGTSLVDFAAPGGDFVLYPDTYYARDMILSTGSANSWYWGAGTSQAAPHVSGVAALIIAEHGGHMKPAQVEAEMRHRADDLGKPGKDDFNGMGRISTGH